MAILIFGLGAGLSILEGINKVRQPHVIENALVNYPVLAFALVFEGAVWIVAFREFRKNKSSRGWLDAFRSSKDPAVFTVLLEDTAAMFGLLAAMVGIASSQALDMPVLDGVASIAIGVILAGTAAFLAHECQSLLTGEGVAPEVRESIRRLASAQAGVVRLNEALTMHFGPRDVLVALSLDFDDGLPAGKVEVVVTEIERQIKAAHPEVTRVFVEAQSFDAHRRDSRSVSLSSSRSLDRSIATPARDAPLLEQLDDLGRDAAGRQSLALDPADADPTSGWRSAQEHLLRRLRLRLGRRPKRAYSRSSATYCGATRGLPSRRSAR